jgi:hypothetical protein
MSDLRTVNCFIIFHLLTYYYYLLIIIIITVLLLLLVLVLFHLIFMFYVVLLCYVVIFDSFWLFVYVSLFVLSMFIHSKLSLLTGGCELQVCMCGSTPHVVNIGLRFFFLFMFYRHVDR